MKMKFAGLFRKKDPWNPGGTAGGDHRKSLPQRTTGLE